MKFLIVFLLALAATTIFFIGYAVGRDSTKYYDGEGNEIPQNVVDLEVKSNFVIMTPQEDSLIRKYFYFKNAIKPTIERFYNGQILYPDYVHGDTLIVTNARFLNCYTSEYNPASDKEIMDMIKQGTRKK